MAVSTPHFGLPFRFSRSSAVVAEQDTIDDIANCVEAILLTHIGWRDEVPGFGVPELAFRLPSSRSGRIETINALVSDQEPRASILMTEAPDRYDNLISHVLTTIELRGGEAT
jgi:phage baseplate assembly protein W